MGAVKIILFALIEGGNTKVETIRGLSTKFLVNALAVFREMICSENENPCPEKFPFSGEYLT